MNYINYKKNELKKLTIADIKQPYPELGKGSKSDLIAKWVMDWIDSTSVSNCLLPTKAEFAYSFGVSLGTIQNVFKILEDNNYILLKQRIGAIIRTKNDKSVLKKQTSKLDISLINLKNYIKGEHLKTGERLPSSRNLAESLGISLNSVRLSVNKLIAENILKEVDGKIVLNNKNFKVNEEDMISKSLVEKTRDDLKQYVLTNFKSGDKLPPNKKLAEKFKVSVKTIHNAIKILEKEDILLSRRGTYGTIVVSTHSSSLFESRPEMSMFASAQDTAQYLYEKTQNRFRRLISENYEIGSKLPSIREFSKQLDVSPNVIRKALNNLAKEGILRFARGRYGGTYVIDVPDVEEQTFRWLAVNPQYAKIETN